MGTKVMLGDKYDYSNSKQNDKLDENGKPYINFKNSFTIEPVKWIIKIPKGGAFQIRTPNDFNIWQRFFIRFIGWSIEKP